MIGRASQLARLALGLLALALLGAGPGPATAGHWIYVDADGATQLTDDPAKIPAGTASPASDAGSLSAAPPAGPAPRGDGRARSDAERRTDRIVAGAIEDLRRGETARAAAALESVLASDPRNPVAHWHLAEIDRRRGRVDSAARHLDAFLAHAGDAYESFRASAERRRRALADEERLSDGGGGPLRLVAAESPHFRVHYDARLGETSRDYARTVLAYLDEAHRSVTARLGVAPREATGVVLYAKAAYLAAHRHRFSFPTVGFYDGRIHVASAAHPEGELRALLFHEFTHAVFAERTGGDRPFWLNEGLAELAERSQRGEAALTRAERAALHRAADTGEWIPLARLAPGFGGLDEGEARVAYLEAMAAAAWLESRLDPRGMGALLDALGAGASVDAALRRAVDVDTAGLEAALRRSIAAEFPASSP